MKKTIIDNNFILFFVSKNKPKNNKLIKRKSGISIIFLITLSSNTLIKR